MDESTAEKNRELVTDGFAAFASGDVEVLRTRLSPDFIEHSPDNPSGRDAFIAYIAGTPVANARLALKRVIADDTYVTVHYQMTEPGDERGAAVVDIWRVDEGLITEHWDVVQPVPEESRVPNGMF
ncbi:MAG TPA: nuclear transport factor 2 family protein [Streptosporangiaceae bacterium]|jgi:predicted SnoaL-like aldol condensation-catalyzing enzyme